MEAVAVTGEYLFTASADKTIRVWDLTTYAMIAVLDLHHKKTITSLAVGAGHFDVQLFSSSDDGKPSFHTLFPIVSSRCLSACLPLSVLHVCTTQHAAFCMPASCFSLCTCLPLRTMPQNLPSSLLRCARARACVCVCFLLCVVSSVRSVLVQMMRCNPLSH